MRLLINIDHIATLRNARGEGYPEPAEAAKACEDAGADGIVFHLREDRRHIQDKDVFRLKKTIRGICDFEMAATDEMLGICSEVKPDLSTLVPEKREELTTEGGLQLDRLYDDFSKRVIPFMNDRNINVSLFIDPVPAHVRLAGKLGVHAIELHTGTYANAANRDERQKELNRLTEAAGLAYEEGLAVNAGHGLNFDNIEPVLQQVPHLADVSIGHALIADAVFHGLGSTVKRMKEIFEKYEDS